MFNQFIGIIYNPFAGNYIGSVVIYNPETDAQLLFYNRITLDISHINIPKSNTPSKVSVTMDISSNNVIELRVRVNPTEIGQSIYTDDFNLKIQ